MRAGIVAGMNPRRGMVAIATQDDGFTIIELLSDFELQIGDKIVWRNDYGLGSELYRNATRDLTAEVYVQNHAVHQAHLRRQLLF